MDAVAQKEGRVTFAGHEKRLQAMAQDLKTLGFSAAQITYILSLIRTHMRPLTEKSTPRAVRRLLAMLDHHHLSISDFMRMRIADKKGNLAKQPYTLSQIKRRLGMLRAEAAKEPALNLNALAVSGRDIMDLLKISPGPRVGKIKEQLLEAVLDTPELNTRDQLIKLIQPLEPLP
jgi:tRNA nucleotidyltransferase/poly(A) polymerase